MYLSLIPIFAIIYTLLPEGYIDHGTLPDNLWTNIYYSAVTVTTLGYGDIVPQNEIAALLVAAEAVMGVVFIGLFLNQLAHRQSRIDKKQDQELESIRERLHECDRLIQYAAVIKRIEDPDELDDSVRDFILTIDMHDWRVLERICINFLTDRDEKKFRKRFGDEMIKVEEDYKELKEKNGGRYW